MSPTQNKYFKFSCFIKLSFLPLLQHCLIRQLRLKNQSSDSSCKNPSFQLEIGKQVLAVDPKYFRPTEVDLLIGDPTKSKEKLGWVPKYDLAGLVKEMVQSDVDRVKKAQLLKDAGY